MQIKKETFVIENLIADAEKKCKLSSCINLNSK